MDTSDCSYPKDGTNGFVDGKMTLDLEDDAAYVNWGDNWRIPTVEQTVELQKECYWVKTNNYNDTGVEGIIIYKAKSNADKGVVTFDNETPNAAYSLSDIHIFLPNIVFYDETGETGETRTHTNSLYWTNSVTSKYNNHNAKTLMIPTKVFWKKIASINGSTVRYAGLSIRAVCKSEPTSTSDAREHDYVDLGLSVKWATCNVGASRPEEYGEYYAWGETYVRDYHNWYNYFDSENASDSNFKVYSASKQTTLNPENDVAHVKWGGAWRMPTDAEIDELIRECNWKRTKKKGVYGYQVTSRKNGKSIFLPSAGSSFDSGAGYTTIYGAGTQGCYWSSSLYDGYSEFASSVQFFPDIAGEKSKIYRYCGCSVRPVCK